MTDFETRARAAARAIHDAVDAPADELAARRSGRGPVRALLIAAAVIVVAAIVGTTLAVRDEGAAPASDVTTFCAQVQQMVTRPVDVINGERQGEAPSLDFLRDAPEEIRPTALAILDASTAHPSGGAPIAVTQRFLRWWQLACFPDAATPAGGAPNARFGPLPAPASFRPCGASNGGANGSEQQIRDAYGTIVVYGDPTLPDPYSDRMIGVVRTKAQQFYSDDHAVPAVVAGHPDAELIDATGMYGAPIAGLGQAVTWRDDRGYVAVIGRGYTREQGPELEAIAARVGVGPNGDEIAAAERDRLARLFSGPVGDVYVQYPSPTASTSFQANYLVRDFGSINLYGLVTDAATLQATRFFAPGLRHATIGGKDVITGTVPLTNSTDGSTVRLVMWRDDDVMLTARVLNQAGTDPRDLPTDADVDAVVASTHRLDRAQWEQLVDAGGACLLRNAGESNHASGSGSSATTGTGPSSTSSTTVTTLGR